VILILASGSDELAASLAIRWEAFGARLVKPADLSRAGWTYRLPKTGDWTAVVDGKVVNTGDLSGVLTRLAHIREADLNHIAFVDRAYVAAEMQAFLSAWLNGLDCTVINRPSPGYLCGPNWRSGQWARCAAGLDIPVVPVQLGTDDAVSPEDADLTAKPGGTPVVIAGGRCFGAVDPCLALQAQRIAEAAGVELLEVRFTGPHAGDAFLSASLQPDISGDVVSAALLSRLQGEAQCR